MYKSFNAQLCHYKQILMQTIVYLVLQDFRTLRALELLVAVMVFRVLDEVVPARKRLPAQLTHRVTQTVGQFRFLLASSEKNDDFFRRDLFLGSGVNLNMLQSSNHLKSKLFHMLGKIEQD
jgi:hypothetical protein